MTSSAASPATPGPVRVLVADGHAPTRAGVRASLDPVVFRIVAEASHARAAVELACAETPDICLLDIDMPGSGIAAASDISKAVPDCAVVMLSSSVKDDDLFDSVHAGVRGYLLKDMDPDRIGPALLGVLAGEAAFPRSLVARVLEEFQGRGRRKLFTPGQRPTQLTEREWEIMNLLGAGISTHDIARRLFVAPGTVRVHISTVLKKLRVGDRQSALRALAG